MKLHLLTSIVGLFISTVAFGQQNEKSVFYTNNGGNNQWLQYQNNHRALYDVIANEAYELLEDRVEKIDNIATKKDWEIYQTSLKSKLFASLDKFEKTPLNQKVVGKIKKKTYSVEKVLFESHPGFFVTGSLFLPKKRQKPAPCIIYCSGHSNSAYKADVYQHFILNLVSKGFVVFAFDPIGQGERIQYLNAATGTSKIGGATSEHTYAGIQTLLTGSSLSDYIIWDGVRVLDFLETRKEVDMQRIGITGRSGGGTQSAMIAAYDNRIYAAAPECYITNYKRLLQSIGPQDAEQNMFQALKMGFDHPDFMHLRAPKPSIIVTTTHDFFSQQGARETFAEAKKSYTALGAPDNITMVEDFGKHESTKNNREAVYTFFQHHLNNPGDPTDKEVELFLEEALWVTETGQIASSLEGNTVFDLNKKYMVNNATDPDQIRAKIVELSGIQLHHKLRSAVYTGKMVEERFEVEKYFLENDSEKFVLPVYVVQKPMTKPKKIMVWLSDKGKAGLLEHPLLNDYLSMGYTIISADLPGIGALYDPEYGGDGFIQGVPFNYTFGAHLVGKSIPGIQAESIGLLKQFVARQHQGKPIDAFVQGSVNSSFLHFTAMGNPFSKIILMDPFPPDVRLIDTEYYDPKHAYSIVPGSLPHYSFKDLVALLGNTSVKIIDSEDQLGSENGKTGLLQFLADN